MTDKVTTAMVLAAGLGKRMRPLTDVVPKPLVRLKGKPLIDHVLDRLAAGGISRAVVNVHYLPDLIEAHVAKRTVPSIVVSDERDALLDTGGGVVRALPLLGDKPFLIHNSDSVWIDGVGSNIARLIAAFDPDRMDSLMLLANGATSLGYEGRGDFCMDSDGVLLRRDEQRESPFVFTGVSIAHPRLFENAPTGAFSLNKLWDRAIDRRRLYGLRLDGVWMHVGTPQSVEEAERWIERAEGA
ncbi:nucleotidyltransferase family protein [Hyphomicrobium sp. LHD-15]|uniref:nucleotidyltransferase family protein n=1 Tax=Hyphomicrobium sp. LHD-15 TaxID=3072142 RepID=UPI00280D3178|nr:nucleotidyltransferase family protein [Hyphomicrobium sp. LHD-15]MDQ8699788.1 nucleotidyltransferase family protein [Hyphomicrobium sp. LHD-15]